MASNGEENENRIKVRSYEWRAASLEIHNRVDKQQTLGDLPLLEVDNVDLLVLSDFLKMRTEDVQKGNRGGSAWKER